MNFHCAACNEPWDTRGTHYTHSDLPADVYLDLLNGAGCPCCPANGVRFNLERNYLPNEEFIAQWQRDVARVSEGVHDFFDGEPIQQQVNAILDSIDLNYSGALSFVEEAKQYPFTLEDVGG